MGGVPAEEPRSGQSSSVEKTFFLKAEESLRNWRRSTFFLPKSKSCLAVLPLVMWLALAWSGQLNRAWGLLRKTLLVQEQCVGWSIFILL